MSDKGVYALGVVIALALCTVFNYGEWVKPSEVYPVPGTERVEAVEKPVPMDEPIEPIMCEPEETETTAVETAVAETTSGRVYLGKYKLTAYCSCSTCCGKWGARTATGTAPVQGRTIAVDPRVIPYGSQVHIDGYGTYIAEDTGGAIKNNRIDVYFNNHTEALNFGVRYADVYLED